MASGIINFESLSVSGGGSGGLSYLGTWNASTNTPTIHDGTGTPGDFYVVSVAGTQDLGHGNVTFNVGDLAILSSDLVWQDVPLGVGSLATNLAGGVLGSTPYQTAPNTTSFVAPNTTTTLKVYTQTGTGSAGASPLWVNALSTNSISSFVVRDASGNFAANQIIDQYAAVVTSGGTTTLTVASAPNQNFTGSSNQDVVLPDATTLMLSSSYQIYNNSSGTLTIKDNTGTTLLSLAAGLMANLRLTVNGSAAGTWVNLTSGAASVVTNLSGGVLGSVPYQSAPNITSFITNNNTTNTLFLSQTGTGSASASPIWSALPVATNSSLGIVEPDNTSISVDGSGIISEYFGARTTDSTFDSTLNWQSLSSDQTIDISTLVIGRRYEIYANGTTVLLTFSNGSLVGFDYAGSSTTQSAFSGEVIAFKRVSNTVCSIV